MEARKDPCGVDDLVLGVAGVDADRVALEHLTAEVLVDGHVRGVHVPEVDPDRRVLHSSQQQVVVAPERVRADHLLYSVRQIHTEVAGDSTCSRFDQQSTITSWTARFVHICRSMSHEAQSALTCQPGSTPDTLRLHFCAGGKARPGNHDQSASAAASGMLPGDTCLSNQAHAARRRDVSQPARRHGRRETAQVVPGLSIRERGGVLLRDVVRASSVLLPSAAASRAAAVGDCTGADAFPAAEGSSLGPPHWGGLGSRGRPNRQHRGPPEGGGAEEC